MPVRAVGFHHAGPASTLGKLEDADQLWLAWLGDVEVVKSSTWHRMNVQRQREHRGVRKVVQRKYPRFEASRSNVLNSETMQRVEYLPQPGRFN